MNADLVFSDEVAKAIRDNMPIVALESTIISHGMPYPVNVETALAVESCVRHEGSIPATIALLNGRIRIGLSSDEIALLGRTERAQLTKVSRADLPYVVSQRLTGSTTVAATMICARLAGISVFATGGIGGVHRGGEKTLDVSADLYELARTDVAVVCAGAKSILDIGRTLEVLETLGVPVIGYGTKIFPAFYYRDSGFELKAVAETPRELAELIRAKRRLELACGVIVANPVPEADAMASQEIERYIEMATHEATINKVTGKEVTPYLLERVAELSSGKSLACNVALIKNNARLAAQIAKIL